MSRSGCPTCIEQAEEVRVVGWDHRNVSRDSECPDCGRPWNQTTIDAINAEANKPLKEIWMPRTIVDHLHEAAEHWNRHKQAGSQEFADNITAPTAQELRRFGLELAAEADRWDAEFEAFETQDAMAGHD